MSKPAPAAAPAVRSPERILLVGEMGKGKTYSWLTIADRYRDVSFHVIDTDYAVPRMLEDERFSTLSAPEGNVHRHAASDWQSLKAATDEAIKACEPGDWLIVDRIDLAWDWVQQFYLEHALGVGDLETFLISQRQKTKGDKPMLMADFGMAEWGHIKKMYGVWFRRLVYEIPCNLLACTMAKKIFDSSKQRTELAPVFGFEPAGQKDLAAGFHTVLFLYMNPREGTHTEKGKEVRGQREITTMKDRSRPAYDGDPLTDFAEQYIEAVAGIESEATRQLRELLERKRAKKAAARAQGEGEE